MNHVPFSLDISRDIAKIVARCWNEARGRGRVISADVAAVENYFCVMHVNGPESPCEKRLYVISAEAAEHLRRSSSALPAKPQMTKEELDSLLRKEREVLSTETWQSVTSKKRYEVLVITYHPVFETRYGRERVSDLPKRGGIPKIPLKNYDL
jgi:hypothetical protein